MVLAAEIHVRNVGESCNGRTSRQKTRPSLTVENYAKAVLHLSVRRKGGWVSTGEVAAALHVTPGTVTTMLKVLADRGLATYKPYSGIKLTKAGRTLALRVLRRHRLIELFLVKTLDLKWDEVHDEAERMEHAVSDSLIDRVDEYLGHPDFDPHGDPIPAADGRMRNQRVSAISVPLGSCLKGERIKLVRVINQQPDFLRFLSENRLEIGTVLDVEHVPSADEPILLRSGISLIAVEPSDAAHLMVEQLQNDKAA